MVSLHLFAWYGIQILLWLCAVLVFSRGIHKRVPVFAGYLAVQSILLLVSDFASVAFSHRVVSIDYFQWIAVGGTGLLAVLEIAVLYELVNSLVLSRASLSPIVRALMRWTAAIMLLIAAGTAAFLGKPGIARVMSAFQTLDFSSNIIKVGLLLALLLFTRTLHISWRNLSAGIALGLAVAGCAEIIGSASLSTTTRAFYMAVDSLRLLGSSACVMIWLTYILLPERQADYSGKHLRLEEITNWDKQMQKIRR